MRLVVYRELTILQAFDQVCFPQWSIAIQQCGMQARHQGEQLPIPAWLRQGRMAHVVIEIKGRVRLPESGPSQAQSSCFEAITERGKKLICIPKVVCQRLQELCGISVLGQGVQRDPGDVHRNLAALGKQEALVHDVELFHRFVPQNKVEDRPLGVLHLMSEYMPKYTEFRANDSKDFHLGRESARENHNYRCCLL